MNIIRSIKNILFSPRCCGCDKVVTPSENHLCKDCSEKVIHPSGMKTRCEICLLPEKECICAPGRFYDRLAFLFFNEGRARNTVYKLKFHSRRDIAEAYATALLPVLEERQIYPDIITAVPMTKKAERKRGYNQAELLALSLSEKTKIEYQPLLYKCCETKTQHTLGRTGRTGNILGAFEPKEEFSEKTDGRKILVVDDIVTGGATVNEAAKTLKIFGADEVFVACAVATKNTKSDVSAR